MLTKDEIIRCIDFEKGMNALPKRIKISQEEFLENHKFYFELSKIQPINIIATNGTEKTMMTLWRPQEPCE